VSIKAGTLQFWVVDNGSSHRGKAAIDRIEFFIDPMSGQVFTHKDVMNYFNRIAITPSDIHFKPSNHIRIMQSLLEEFSKCFDNESKLYKKTELLMLSRMLSE